MLYGLDLAKKPISRDRQAVVVEGYTDVMACHLAGIETAVATCGTAFGVEHIKTLRRIMRDENDTAPAKVVFTFDGDAAGQKAAMRAFGEDQRWASQSFVAVEASGQDPCELRQSGGDPAVRALVEDAVPMFEFAVRTTINRFDLDTAEGRVQALRAAAPIIAGIRDRSLRPEYTRTVAGWLGLEVEQVAAEVGRAGRMAARESGASGGAAQPGPGSGRRGGPHDGERRGGPGPGGGDEPGPSRPDAMARPDLRDPVVFAERQLLQAVLQFPSAVDQGLYDSIEPASFTAAAHRAVHDAVAAAGGLPAAATTAVWADKVAEAAAATVRPLVSELAVAPVPARVDPTTGVPDPRYVKELLVRVREVSLTRRIGDAMSALRRMDSSDPVAARALAVELQALQRGAGDAARDTGLMRLFPVRAGRGGRPQLPPEVVAALALPHGDRVLSFATDDNRGGHLVASTWALSHVTTQGQLAFRRPWHLVDAGSWQPEAATLTVTWTDGARPGQWTFRDQHTLLPETVRERVQASVVLSTRLVLGGATHGPGRHTAGPGHPRADPADRPGPQRAARRHRGP